MVQKYGHTFIRSLETLTCAGLLQTPRTNLRLNICSPIHRELDAYQITDRFRQFINNEREMIQILNMLFLVLFRNGKKEERYTGSKFSKTAEYINLHENEKGVGLFPLTRIYFRG